MRIFKRYLPLMVAKHVKTFYQGFLYIQDCGKLEFKNGRLLMPILNANNDEDEKQAAKVLQFRVKEVNRLINDMAKAA